MHRIVPKSIEDCTISGIKNKTYTGEEITQDIVVTKTYAFTDGETTEDVVETIDPDLYTVTYKDNINAGTAKVTIEGTNGSAGTVTKTFKIAKVKNVLSVKGKTATIKYKNLKKKAQTVKRSKAMTVSKKYGKVTYKIVGAKKGLRKIKLSEVKKIFKISSTTGKIKVKKGLKKGTYKITVKVKAAGGTNYTTVTKTVTFKIKIK